MRKIILNMMVTVDGFMEGENKDLSWHLADNEWDKYAIENMDTTDTIIFGRVCYELFESYWPKAAKNPNTGKDDLTIAKWIDSSKKIVFSRTMKEVSWNNTTLLHDVSVDEINTLKQGSGKDMIMFGGAGIAQSFMNLNLIDEYRLFVNPIILGKGKLLFENLKVKLNLKLINTKHFKSGLVGLYYVPER
jgi:dihydrofolate reductase